MSSPLLMMMEETSGGIESLRKIPNMAFLGTPSGFLKSGGSQAKAGDTLVTWQDESPASRSLTLATGSLSVASYTNNGKTFNALAFGGNQILSNTVQGIAYTAHTLMIVASVTGMDRDLIGSGGISTGDILLQVLPKAHLWDSNGIIHSVTGTTSPTATWKLYEQWYDGNTLQVAVNGIVENSTSFTTGVLPMAGLYVGNRNGFVDTQTLMGGVATACVMSRGATTGERQQIRRVLGALAGISL